MMLAFNLKAWTGPVIVKEVAAKCAAAGLHCLPEGTEHVYVVVEAPDYHEATHQARAALVKTHGTTFGLNFRRA